jgi:hypothetical protein
MVKRKPVKLFGKHFPEVEIKLCREITVAFQAPAQKMARYRLVIIAPKPK